MDDAEAVKWIHKAADQNCAVAQCNLGGRYVTGRGVTKDEAEAVKWYRKAAEQDEAKAQFCLGGCYTDGRGVMKDEAEAVKWYRKAAEQNNSTAQFILGSVYMNAQGVPEDRVEAYKWLLLAAKQDDEAAKRFASALEVVMTQEQIAQGRVLAGNFRPRTLFGARSDGFGEAFTQPKPDFSGTGFFITEDGYLVTNQHVVTKGTNVRLVTATGILSARAVKLDAASDLALLKVQGRFVPLPIATSHRVKLGNTVATVGFPNIGLQGFAPKLAKGEVASLSGMLDDGRYFQISVPVQPGNSGGALVDERGNVVGVVAAKLSARAALAASGALPENVNYAVKSSFLLGFLESVPEVVAKLKKPETKERKFEDVVKSAEQAAVLVLVY